MSEDYRIVDNRNPGGGLIPLRERFPRWAAREDASREAAIGLFCAQCMGGEVAEIAKCTALACPLYKWRPTSFEQGREPSPERRVEMAARLARNLGRTPTVGG
jgi:hypothetical protein